MRCAKIICLNVGFVWSRFVQKILKRIDLLLNRLCTTVTTKTTRIFAPKLVETSRFSNLMVKNMWSCAGGLKKPQWPLSVCCLGLVATKGVLALKSMHKGLGSSQTSHILVCDFLGLLLPIFVMENTWKRRLLEAIVTCWDSPLRCITIRDVDFVLTLEEYDRFLSLNTPISQVYRPPTRPHFHKWLAKLLGLKTLVVRGGKVSLNPFAHLNPPNY